MDTEECGFAQHFDVPVLEVECLMRNYNVRVDGWLVGGGIRGRGVNGRFVIRSIWDGEVRESGDADGWRLNNGSDRGFWS